MSDEFNYAAFHRRRKLIKGVGMGLVAAGVFTIVDMVSTIPIPLTGSRAVFAGTALLLGGLYALYQGYKLPVEEALYLIRRRERGITASELVHDMLVDRVTADRLIVAMVRRGFLRRASGQTGEASAEELFDPVR